MNKILSTNLRSLRKEKGYTQEDVANYIGEKRSTYSAWEECRSSPSPSQLKNICDIFEIDDLYLFISKPLMRC